MTFFASHVLYLVTENQVDKLCPPGRILYIYEGNEQNMAMLANTVDVAMEGLNADRSLSEVPRTDLDYEIPSTDYKRRRTRSDTYSTAENDPWDADASKDVLGDHDLQQVQDHDMQLDETLAEELGNIESGVGMADENVNRQSASPGDTEPDEQSTDPPHHFLNHVGYVDMCSCCGYCMICKYILYKDVYHVLTS